MTPRRRPPSPPSRRGFRAAWLAVAAVALTVVLAGARPAAGATSAKARAAAANVLHDTTATARDRDCLAQALGVTAPASALDPIAQATSVDDLPTPTRTAAYAALRRCPRALGVLIARDSAADGVALKSSDALCIGTAMAKLTAAQLAEIADDDADPSPGTQLAVFGALKACPPVLGALFTNEFEAQGVTLTARNTACLSNALARRMSASQLRDLSNDNPTRASQLALWTAFKDCPEAIGPLMAEELASGLGAEPKPADVACVGRSLVNRLTASELYELANDNMGDRLLTRVLTALGACPDVLIDLIAKGMTESSDTLTGSEARCIVRAMLADFTVAELVTATTGTPSGALEARFANAMERYLQRCAPGKTP